MTIGIAVSGPSAGLAALRALGAVESVGRGAIGGFVSFVAIDAGGDLLFAETQNGGTGALFGGSSPRESLLSAPLAVLMASGPDRPEPLTQFTPADPRAGLVTGHRLPNMPGSNGVPPNIIALSKLQDGASPKQAVAAGLADDPEADAGLIAMDLSGRIALGNSDAVARRDDIGEALVEHNTSGLRIGVLHNSIFPRAALAQLAVSAAIDAVSPGDRVDGEALLTGVPLQRGETRSLVLGTDGAPEALVVTSTDWFGGRWEGSAVQRGDPVLRKGRIAGRITREVYCIVSDGKVIGGRGGERAGWRSSENDQEI